MYCFHMCVYVYSGLDVTDILISTIDDDKGVGITSVTAAGEGREGEGGGDDTDFFDEDDFDPRGDGGH